MSGVTAVFGLYDPLTKERIMTRDGLVTGEVVEVRSMTTPTGVRDE